jgi:hypothetical protein
MNIRLRSIVSFRPTHLVALAFFIYVYLLALMPLVNSDLWFHLKTGELMLENRALPGPVDPFSFTMEGRPLEGSRLGGLRSQWLGQAVFYLVFSIAQEAGFALFRALLVVLPFVLIYVWSVKADTPHGRGGDLLSLAVLAFPALLTAMFFSHSYERPQAFSFLFVCITLVLLHRLRSGGGWLLFSFLPLLMALWSNMHGGHALGVAIIGLAAGSELLVLVLHRFGPGWAGRFGEPALRPLRFFFSCALGVAFSALHPGGFQQVRWMLGLAGRILAEGGEAARDNLVLEHVLEYKPLMHYYHVFNFTWPLFIICFFALSLAALGAAYWFRGRVRLWEALTAVFMVWFGVSYYRGVPFALPALALCLTWALAGLRGWRRIAPAIVFVVATAVLIASYGLRQPWRLDPRPPDRWVSAEYPDHAVRFMRERGVKGPLFNFLGWGGYLIWTTYPDYKVFIDGRELDSRALHAYWDILRSTPRWRDIFHYYGINAVIIPVLSEKHGGVFPLLEVMAVQGHEGWELVYLWKNAAVFVRAGETVNSHVVECCKMPFDRLYGGILDYADLLLIRMPGDPKLHMSKALAYAWSGRHGEARAILETLPDSPKKRAVLGWMSVRDGGG